MYVYLKNRLLQKCTLALEIQVRAYFKDRLIDRYKYEHSEIVS